MLLIGPFLLLLFWTHYHTEDRRMPAEPPSLCRPASSNVWRDPSKCALNREDALATVSSTVSRKSLSKASKTLSAICSTPCYCDGGSWRDFGKAAAGRKVQCLSNGTSGLNADCNRSRLGRSLRLKACSGAPDKGVPVPSTYDFGSTGQRLVIQRFFLARH